MKINKGPREGALYLFDNVVLNLSQTFIKKYPLMKINKGPREGALYFTQMYYLKNNNSLYLGKIGRAHV